jgi:hypothetical protein
MGGCASRLRDELGLLGEPGTRFGKGPHTGTQCACAGPHGLSGVLPPGPQLSGVLAASYWRLPADILCGFGTLLQAQLQGATAFGGIAIRPGPFDACTAGMGVPRLGNRALPAPLTTGVFGGGRSQVTPELAGGIKARQITQCRDDGDGHGALHPPQGLQGRDHRLQAPGLHRLVACVFEPVPACSGRVHRPDIFLEDDLRRGSRTDPCREPAQVSRTPGGLACVADVVPQPKRCETERGGLEAPNDVFTSPAQVADGSVLHART